MSDQPWTLDPPKYKLVNHTGKDRFTAAGWAEQQWPPCPVCGTTVVVDALDVRHMGDPESMYIPGLWECPNRCNPRRQP